jgi:hypothetical protein
MELLDVAGPAAKGRSGEAAEDEQQRALAGEVTQLHARAVLEPDGRQGRKRIADLEPVGAPVSRDRRYHDLALVRRKPLGVRAVARVEAVESGIAGRRHATYGATATMVADDRREPPSLRRGNDGMARRAGKNRQSLRRRVAVLSAAVCCSALAPVVHASPTQSACHVTVATRVARQGPSAAGFDYGTGLLGVQLGWPNGTLPAGILADGGSWATVEDDGSIRAKVGWWRGVRGRLRVTGRRLDAPAPPLEAHVPGGYGPRGFQPTGLVFPTVGCWRVVGAVGDARLTFVVRVTRLDRR